MNDPIRKGYWRDFTSNPVWNDVLEHLNKVETQLTRELVNVVSEGKIEDMKVQSGKIEGVRGTITWLQMMKKEANAPDA